MFEVMNQSKIEEVVYNVGDVGGFFISVKKWGDIQVRRVA
jgi:hypothetical protein